MLNDIPMCHVASVYIETAAFDLAEFSNVFGGRQSGYTPFPHRLGHLPGKAANISSCENSRNVGLLSFKGARFSI
jgi:hypothetical protein